MNTCLGLKHIATGLILVAAASVPARASLTFITDPGAGTGAERCLSSGAGNGGTCSSTPGGTTNVYAGLDSMVQLFAITEGDATLTRIDDSDDELWTANPGAGVFGLARSATRNFVLGELAGASGENFTEILGVTGSAAAPVEFLPSIPAGQNGNGDLQVSGYSGGLPVFTSISTGVFRFAIQCAPGCTPAGQTWSSLPSDNTDGQDHMVTWELTGGNVPVGDTWYIAGFENGTDFDFNDYVFVYQNVTPGSANTPEPGSAIFVGASLLLSAAFLRLRKTASAADLRKSSNV
jgi:hypothetical protein